MQQVEYKYMWGEGKVPTISAKAATRHERGSGKESLICNFPESKRLQQSEHLQNDVERMVDKPREVSLPESSTSRLFDIVLLRSFAARMMHASSNLILCPSPGMQSGLLLVARSTLP